uniref:SET domain protein n=1 Tax=Strongyloides stercoralis TaxID=6248 RepID=A0A0K0EG89_STRER
MPTRVKKCSKKSKEVSKKGSKEDSNNCKDTSVTIDINDNPSSSPTRIIKRGRRRKKKSENENVQELDKCNNDKDLRRKAKACSEKIIEKTFDEVVNDDDPLSRASKLSYILTNCLVGKKQLSNLNENDIEKLLTGKNGKIMSLLPKSQKISSCGDEANNVVSNFTGNNSNNNQEFEKSKKRNLINKKKGVIYMFEDTYPKYYTDILDSYSLEDIYGNSVNTDIYPVMYSWTDPVILSKISYQYNDLPDYLKLLVTENELYNYIPGQQIGHTIFSIPVKIKKFNDNDDGWKKQISFFESIVLSNCKILLDTQLDINVPPTDSTFLELICCKFYYHSIISSRTDKRRMVCLENDAKELKELANYIRKYGIIGKEGNKNLNSSLLTSTYMIFDKSKLFKDPEIPYFKNEVPHIVNMTNEERDSVLKRKATSIKVYRNINHGYPHVIAYFDKEKEIFDIGMSRREYGNPWTSVRGYIKDSNTKYNGPTLQQSKPSYSGEKKSCKRVLKLISQEVLIEDVEKTIDN